MATRGRRRVAWLSTPAVACAAAALCVMGACGTLSAPAGEEAGDASHEADLVDGADLFDAFTELDGDDTFGDASFDAVGCREIADGSVPSISEGWKVEPAATLGSDAAVLVPAATNQAGAIWMEVKPPTQRLHATAVILTPAPGYKGRGAALAMAWSADPTQPKLGGIGNSFAFCGGPADGVGVAFDTYINKATLLDTRAATCGRDASSPDLVLSQSAAATLDFDHGTASVTIGATGTKNIRLTTRALEIHWVGFTASTGSSYIEHALGGVQIFACP